MFFFLLREREIIRSDIVNLTMKLRIVNFAMYIAPLKWISFPAGCYYECLMLDKSLRRRAPISIFPASTRASNPNFLPSEPSSRTYPNEIPYPTAKRYTALSEAIIVLLMRSNFPCATARTRASPTPLHAIGSKDMRNILSKRGIKSGTVPE